MRRKRRQHGADEFGKTGLGSATAIGDRGIGAAAGVTVDGIVERESGLAPGWYPVAKLVAIVLGVLLLVSLTIVVVMTLNAQPEALPSGSHRGLWISTTSTRPVTSDTKFEFMSEPDVKDEVTVWWARPAEGAVYLIDRREVSAAEFVAYLQGGSWPADVNASDDGVFARVEVLTPEDDSD